MNSKIAVPLAGLLLIAVPANAQNEQPSDPNLIGNIVKHSEYAVIPPAPKKEKSGMLKIRSTVDDINVTYGKTSKIEAVTEYAIPFYRINYLTSSDYQNDVGSGSVDASARMIAELQGVSIATFDALTERAYKDLNEKMSAAGFTIRPLEGLSTAQKYIGKSKFPKETKSAYQDVPDGIGFEAGKFSNANLMVEMKDKVNVMSVDLDAQFLITNRNEKSFTLGAKEEVVVSQGANVGGRIAIRVPSNDFRFEIGQPPYSPIAFGKLEDATTSGDKVGDGLKMGLGMLGLGKKKRSTTKRGVMIAEEAKYSEAMWDALQKANSMIVDYLVSQNTVLGQSADLAMGEAGQ